MLFHLRLGSYGIQDCLTWQTSLGTVQSYKEEKSGEAVLCNNIVNEHVFSPICLHRLYSLI